MRALSLYFVVAALAFCNDAYAARILGLFPHTGKSHQWVFDPMLRRLAERGHHLTVATFFPLKDPPANYTSVNLQGIAEIGLEVMDLSVFEEPPSFFQVTLVNRIINQMFGFYPLVDMALDVCNGLVDFPPLREALQKDYDIVLVENFNSDCMLGLLDIYRVKAPTVALLSSQLMQISSDRMGLSDNPSYVPSVSTSFTSNMTFWERLENTISHNFFKIMYRQLIQTKEQAIIEQHFGRKINDLRDLGGNYSLMLVNTFHALHGVRPSLPGVINVGGMHLPETRNQIPEYIERFLNESDEGVVLFSLGSLIRTSTMPKYKEDIIMNALSKLKQRVIWKYEDSEDEGTRIGNILRVKWIPQYDLLQHPKVIAFIAHGGLLGMTEAVAAGKPMLVMPFFGDQNMNAANAMHVGLGKMIAYEGLTEDSLYTAVLSVISPEMRLSARRVSKMWHDRQNKPLDTAIYWIEHVIRWPDAQLYSISRDMSFIQYLLIDVASAVIVGLLLLLFVLKVILNLLLRFVAGSPKKEKLH